MYDRRGFALWLLKVSSHSVKFTQHTQTTTILLNCVQLKMPLVSDERKSTEIIESAVSDSPASVFSALTCLALALHSRDEKKLLVSAKLRIERLDSRFPFIVSSKCVCPVCREWKKGSDEKKQPSATCHILQWERGGQEKAVLGHLNFTFLFLRQNHLARVQNCKTTTSAQYTFSARSSQKYCDVKRLATQWLLGYRI